jgi:hypothetical protein
LVFVLVERADVPPVFVEEAAVVVVLDDLVELVLLDEVAILVFASSLAGDLLTS